MIDGFTGPVQCSQFSWTAQAQKEPFFFKDDSNITKNADSPIWVRHSPDFYINFTDDRIFTLKSGKGSSYNGILVMIKPGEIVSATGSAAANSTIAFTLPTNAIVIANTEGYFCNNVTPFTNSTASKVINLGSYSLTIPLGNDSNNRTGSCADFPVGFNVQDLSFGIFKTLLQTNGFITTNNIFRCKFAHIITGIGHCYLRNVCCSC